MKAHTLASMFESNKQALEDKLEGLALPKDASKILSIVSEYFDELFNQNGEYRQNLSQAEDYILQAALSLLNAQQEMGKKLSEKVVLVTPKPSLNAEAKQEKEQPLGQKPIEKFLNQQIDGKNTLIGAGGGALLGKVVLGTGWGAVFGAIAGTALVLYMATRTNEKPSIKQKSLEAKTSATSYIQNNPIDVSAFLDVVQQTCESIDTLITTFRNQIKKVVNKYESQEKPTLEKEYGILLDGIQSLLGVAYSKQTDEKRLKKIDERIEQLVDSLENYGLEVISYSEEHKALFDELSSDKVTEPTMICPAIVKENNIVRKGKVFVKQ